MQINDHHVVTLTYKLRDRETKGQLLEIMNSNYPLVFLFGSGKMLPAFEDRLRGLEEGEAFQFSLSPEEAYGYIEKGNIIDLPLSIFQQVETPLENLLVQGNPIALTDDEGQTHNGKILSWTDQTVKIDFNHSMAGRQLHFTGSVLQVRKATVDELIRNHYIPQNGLHRPDDPYETGAW